MFSLQQKKRTALIRQGEKRPMNTLFGVFFLFIRKNMTNFFSLNVGKKIEKNRHLIRHGEKRPVNTLLVLPGKASFQLANPLNCHTNFGAFCPIEKDLV